jgi:beta-glucosidase
MFNLLSNYLESIPTGIVCLVVFMFSFSFSLAQKISPDMKAKEVEKNMTDDERFALITSLVGHVPSLGIPNTIVVLETGNASSMPWRSDVKAILQAWYPGQVGGTAIAEILTGKVNPSGRLPITFPESLAHTPRPTLSGLGTPWGTPTTIEYNEGSDAGYRWFGKKSIAPMYAFGHGLSYTSFSYSGLKVTEGKMITASFTVTNAGKIKGADVPQLYLTREADEISVRLLGFERIELSPGEYKEITLTVDPRLLAHFNWERQQWEINEGDFQIALGSSAVDLQLHSTIKLKKKRFGK